MYRFKIPDRWTEYAPFGETVADTKIIAVKTPLEQIFKRSEMVPDGLLSEQMFTPTQLVDGLLDHSHLLSLVIDLTNTTRYYDPKELRDRGIDHVKIKCPGQTIPPDSVYKQFSSKLEGWLQRAKPAEVVAVHCTHGVNRTGYLVCRYLMEHKGFTYSAAVAAFNKARGHDIENQEYLDHLEQGCPPLPEPPPPASPPAPLKDHHSLPSNTDTRAPSSLPKTTHVPSRKRPRDEERSEGDREQHSHYGYHGQRARDHHQSDEYHRGGSRHYHRGNPYEDRLHWEPHKWTRPPHHHWEPRPSHHHWGPRSCDWGTGWKRHQHKS